MDKNLLEFLKYIKCPLSGESLEVLDQDSLSKLNRNIELKEVFFLDQKIVECKINCALVNFGKKIVYIVEDGIPILMSSKAIIIDKGVYNYSNDQFHLDERHSIQTFYDEIGWKPQASVNKSSCFNDAKLFEDIREISKDYISNANSRISKIFNYPGKYFLDAASGPIQYDDYLNFSKNFEIRVCVDISILALKTAREKLKDKGIYILADITNLPFQNNTFSGVVSVHTIYHVPANLQKTAFTELERVLAIDSKCAVVYSYGNQSALMKFFMFPMRVMLFFKNIINVILGFKNKPATLYFYTHKMNWIYSLMFENCEVEVGVWRSVSVPFLKIFIHRVLFGKVFLKILSILEDNNPKLFGKIGQYPLIIVRKRS